MDVATTVGVAVLAQDFLWLEIDVYDSISWCSVPHSSVKNSHTLFADVEML